MTLADREIESVLDVEDIIMCHIQTECDSRFVIVDLLTRGSFVLEKTFLNSVVVLLISSEENKVVVHEKEMQNTGTATCHFNTMELILANFMVKDGRKTLRAKHKEIGERGSLCLSPLEGTTLSTIRPLTLKE